MKKRYIIILGVLWLVAFFNFIFDVADNEADIVTAFSNERFLSTKSTIEATVDYGNVYLSDEDRKNMIAGIAAELGISDNFAYDCIREDGIVTASLRKDARNAVTTIKIITLENKKENNIITLQQYIKVNIDIENSLESAVYYRNQIEEIFNDMEIESDISLILRGNIKGTLSNSEKNNITDDIIKNLDGEIITQNRGNELFTVYAYTEKIKDYVVNGTSKTNINIAISYDEINNETNIYIATPIINSDY